MARGGHDLVADYSANSRPHYRDPSHARDYSAQTETSASEERDLATYFQQVCRNLDGNGDDE